MSRWRDPQLQVGENYSDFYQMAVNYLEILLIDVTFYLHHVQKLVSDVLIITFQKKYI